MTAEYERALVLTAIIGGEWFAASDVVRICNGDRWKQLMLRGGGCRLPTNAMSVSCWLGRLSNVERRIIPGKAYLFRLRRDKSTPRDRVGSARARLHAVLRA